MSTASEEAALRYPPRYWPGHEPDGDHPGKLAYLDGITTDDLSAAFEAGAEWQSSQPPTARQIETAAEEIIAWAKKITHDPAATFQSYQGQTLASIAGTVINASEIAESILRSTCMKEPE
jgi:hypothetical protein